ncbi:MAG TPA: bifunctional biotin--[acetyl-CoA-carboxylase] ligase/biotin operon repressor BirA [Luteimonas sp.]|nr:bifunctional biotin--[acetyl-CoA-carboxylase] ligase/biotin operon repressor BirA [Luteimonas sp.]
MVTGMALNAERALLQRLAEGPVGGHVLAAEAGQTRAAVWKRVAALRAAGVAIEAVPGRGYALARPLDLLDAAQIRAGLGHGIESAIAALEVAWSIDSTNAELLRRPAPRAGVAVLLAERQTGGRGRRGRSWASPLAANLYLSLGRVFEGGLARLGGLSLVVGVAVAEALQALGADSVRVKWPNDLVVVDAGSPGSLRKLGGVLVEGGGEHAGPVHAVVGIGLNLAMPPAAAQAIDQPWVDLVELVPACTRNAVAATLLSRLVPALEMFDRDGLVPFADRYARLDTLAGWAVEVRAGRVVHAGVACGIAADGALRVRTADGERQHHAGEVSVRRTGAGS